MQTNYTYMHYLAYAISLTDNPYKSYFRGLAIRETTLDSEETYLKEYAEKTQCLNELTRAIKTNTPMDKKLEEELQEKYLKKINYQYGYSSKILSDILYMTIGYEVHSHMTLRERIKKRQVELTSYGCFMDTEVEGKNIDEDIKDRGFRFNLQDMSSIIEYGNIRLFTNRISFYLNLKYFYNKYVNSHLHIKAEIERMYSHHDVESTLDSLTELIGAIRKHYKETDTLELIHKILDSESDKVISLLEQVDGCGLFDHEDKTSLSYFKNMIESILILNTMYSVLNIQEV